MALVVSVAVLVSVGAVLWPGPTHRPMPGTSRSAGRQQRTLRIAGGVTLAVLVGMTIGWFVTILAGAAIAGSRWWRARIEQSRQAERLTEALPETIDLLAVIFGAGGTAGQCLDVLAERGPKAILPAVADSNRRRAAGTPIIKCLDGLADDLGSAYRPAIRVLVATERDGAPVATLLERLADESRSVRRRQMEARARRLPVLLLGPLVGCFLPAVLVGTIVPLVFVSIDRLTG